VKPPCFGDSSFSSDRAQPAVVGSDDSGAAQLRVSDCAKLMIVLSDNAISDLPTLAEFERQLPALYLARQLRRRSNNRNHYA
jgi:hypothetical protein